jgi:hypothetical protein
MVGQKNKKTNIQIMNIGLNFNNRPKRISHKESPRVTIDSLTPMEKFRISPLCLTPEEKVVISKRIRAFKKLWLPISIKKFWKDNQNTRCSNDLVPYTIDYLENYPPIEHIKNLIANSACIDVLYADVLLEIIEYLDIKTIMNMAFTCRSLYYFVISNNGMKIIGKKLLDVIKDIDYTNDFIILTKTLEYYQSFNNYTEFFTCNYIFGQIKWRFQKYFSEINMSNTDVKNFLLAMYYPQITGTGYFYIHRSIVGMYQTMPIFKFYESDKNKRRSPPKRMPQNVSYIDSDDDTWDPKLDPTYEEDYDEEYNDYLENRDETYNYHQEICNEKGEAYDEEYVSSLSQSDVLSNQNGTIDDHDPIWSDDDI